MNGERPLLLFDLGGVLVDVAPVQDMLTSLGLPAGPVLQARWASIDAWVRLEIGEIDGETFAEQFRAELGLDVDARFVLSAFEAWNLGLYPGSMELLDELRARYRLAVLSNTNEVHWRRLSGEMNIPGLVDRAFASHLIGMRKPDSRVYHHVSAELGVRPGEVTFFDDNADNVAAAASLGMSAWQVQGIDALRARVGALGLL